MDLARRGMVVLALLGSQAWAGSKLDHEDALFLSDAAAEALAEIQLGQLAIERGIDPQVKALGRRMVDDYSQAERELANLAAAKGADLPKEMKAADRAAYARLSARGGAAFDPAYLDLVVARQHEAINEFETEAALGTDSRLKEWASQRALKLRAHRDLARDDRQHL